MLSTNGTQCNTPKDSSVCAWWAAHSQCSGDRPPADLSACLSCSDDEDVAPLSAKFADIYPLSNYDDTEVVANMNGMHSELNGGGENMALKDEVQCWLLPSDRQRRGLGGRGVPVVSVLRSVTY